LFITFATYVLSPVNIIMELRVIFRQIAPNVEGLKRFHELEEEEYATSIPFVSDISVIKFSTLCLAQRVMLHVFYFEH